MKLPFGVFIKKDFLRVGRKRGVGEKDVHDGNGVCVVGVGRDLSVVRRNDIEIDVVIIVVVVVLVVVDVC